MSDGSVSRKSSSCLFLHNHFDILFVMHELIHYFDIFVCLFIYLIFFVFVFLVSFSSFSSYFIFPVAIITEKQKKKKNKYKYIWNRLKLRYLHPLAQLKLSGRNETSTNIQWQLECSCPNKWINQKRFTSLKEEANRAKTELE